MRFVIRATKRSKEELDAIALGAATNALGWKLAQTASNPFAVDYRGMHEGRTT